MDRNGNVIQREDSWHLDKKVPIALILSILGWGILSTWWISDAINDLKMVKVDVAKLEHRITEGENRDKAFADLLPRLEERQKQTNDLLDRIWKRVDNQYGQTLPGNSR